jgi:uncharacterized C2H2 Zn-finger protein
MTPPLHPDEYICPRCGAVCSSLTEYHRHNEREHGEAPMRRKA